MIKALRPGERDFDFHDFTALTSPVLKNRGRTKTQMIININMRISLIPVKMDTSFELKLRIYFKTIQVCQSKLHG